MIINHEQKHRDLDNLIRNYSTVVTALPAADSSNSGQHRTLNNIDFVSDGTRWLSSQVFPLLLTPLPSARTNNALAATTANVLFASHPNNTSDIQITGIACDVGVQTTHNNTNYWQIVVRTRQSTGGASVGSSFTGDTRGSLVISPNLIRVNNFVTTTGSLPLPQVVTLANFYDCLVDYTMVGAPGSILWNTITVWYRLIG